MSLSSGTKLAHYEVLEPIGKGGMGGGCRDLACHFAVVVALFLGAGTGYGQNNEKIEGYLEWRRQDIWIVDGQRVAFGRSTEFKGKDDAASPEITPLGYEVKAEGVRQEDGVLRANKVEARRNDNGGLERDILAASDELEKIYRYVGQLFQFAPDGLVGLGELYTDGPRHERVRPVVDALLPPYIPASDVRVYVVDSPEWNAVAMGNYSIYVYSGLIDDTDDDELALVLGHELAHASHEHTRRQQQRIRSLAARAQLRESTPQGTKLQFSELGAHDERAEEQERVRAFSEALTREYGRELEDQADRVGMRYAYEAGYDVSKGPRLWERFGERYGEPSVIRNFFMGSQGRWSDRAQGLRDEIELNYRDLVP